MYCTVEQTSFTGMGGVKTKSHKFQLKLINWLECSFQRIVLWYGGISRHQQISTMDWPACSPDLNPIEHVWDKLGRAVRKRRTLHNTLLNLRQLLEEWIRIPQRYIQTLINSMRRRCTACRAARGGATRY